MAAGNTGLDAILAKLKKLGTLGADAARIAAPLVEAEVKKTAAAGLTPDGKPWPAKKDGGRALVHAADALSVKAVGSVVVVKLEGPEVLHNFGTGHAPKRQILPDGGAALPANVERALERAAAEAFKRATGAG